MTLAPTLATLPSQATAEESKPVASGFTVAEFFAGIGLARLGLEQAGLKVAWANDLASKKRDLYLHEFGEDAKDHYVLADIKDVAERPEDFKIPQELDLAWASFPCTDLSLAGGREGLAGKHSGTFWDFTKIIDKLERRPRVVALENVNGFATSHGGEDLRAAIKELNKLGYSVDVLTLDARSWVPQSRPRLFVIGCATKPAEEGGDERNTFLRPKVLDPIFADPSLDTHRAALPSPPPHGNTGWTELVNRIPVGEQTEAWWDERRMTSFRNELSEIQRYRISELEDEGGVLYRTAYRRTRGGVPAWEIRADDIAGCLRTTGGGSSKQAVVRIEKGDLRARWMTPREYAALMGAPTYKLLKLDNQARMGFGDAVCVNAVAWLAEHYLKPHLALDAEALPERHP